MWRIALLLLAASVSVEALNCVQCNSEYDPWCMDPVNRTTIGISTMACPGRQICRKTTSTKRGVTQVIRQCADPPAPAPMGCSWEINRNSSGPPTRGWDCFCNEDVCNSAPALATTTAGALLLLLAAALTAAQ